MYAAPAEKSTSRKHEAKDDSCGMGKDVAAVGSPPREPL